MNKRRNKANPKATTVNPAALAMLPLAEQNNMETMWDRLTRQSCLRDPVHREIDMLQSATLSKVIHANSSELQAL